MTGIKYTHLRLYAALGNLVHEFRVYGDSRAELMHHLLAMRRWCIEQFGPSGLERWSISGSSVCFSDEDDAMAFKLRWV